MGSIPDFLSSPATVSNLTTLLDRSPVYVTSSENSFLTFVSFQTSTRPSRHQPDLPDNKQTFQTSTRPSRQQTDLPDINQTFQTSTRPSRHQPDLPDIKQTFQTTNRPSRQQTDLPDINQTLPFCHKCKNMCNVYYFFCNKKKAYLYTQARN